MAIKNTTKDVETIEEAKAADLLLVVNDGIMQVIEDHDINVQKSRYKAMRAIAWQAFIESIDAGDFHALVERASTNVDNLPSGWELTAKAANAKEATPVKARSKEVNA
ncbi:hypothetical protein [Microbacterium sp. K5D]|uniref:hypothetical protein n=1 Tax=Microbacterium sp. K5D TaxID=2305436 RepID=UPI00109CFA1B|nr:hypothetical protein [Microbacterium sp. K5D]